MKKTRVSDNKKRIGRPPTGLGTLVGQRWRDDKLEEIDRWRKGQAGLPGRGEAIRRLVELGLTIKTKATPSERLRAAHSDRAKELATKTIEKIIDTAAPPKERLERKRRLTKGPTEFREARVDQPRAKGK